MLPYIHTSAGDIPVFQLAVVMGFLAMVLILHYELRVAEDRDKEEVYIFAKVFISAFVGYISSALLDSLLKMKQNGGFVISGVTYYGGLIGSVICMYILLKAVHKNTQYTVKQWFDMLTLPLIAFHICGRIGCFFAGCCYGKATEGILGVNFSTVTYKCYPTQLFEAVVLVIIMLTIITFFSKDRFRVYLLIYAVARFVIEFFRGDNRGEYFLGFSPAQVISILIVLCVSVWFYMDYMKKRREKRTSDMHCSSKE